MASSSQFFGLNIASSALSAFQASINTAANNVSNVQTEGYSKQVTNLEASGALRVNAKYGTTGTGVTAKSIERLRDAYYDTKYRDNQSDFGRYEKKLYYMQQIEMYYEDDHKEIGFSTLLKKMFNNLDTVQTHTGDENVRKQFISSAQSLATYFNGIASSLSDLQTGVNQEVKNSVDTINSIAQKIALINRQINQIEIQGGHASELRDQRDVLVDELSAIVPIEISETPIKNSNYPDMDLGIYNYAVKLNGQKLVNGYEYQTLTCEARPQRINQSDIAGLYDITWTNTGVSLDPSSSAMSGSLKALIEIRDGNNANNFTGTIGNDKPDIQDVTVDGRTVTQIRVTDPSITAIEKLGIAEKGLITVRNNSYQYTNFEINADGSYTFTLERELNSTEKSKFYGQKASIGKSVDAMGIPYYMSQMNEFLRNFAKAFNDIERGEPDNPGVDMDGKPMGSFFVANKTLGGEFDFTDTAVSTTSNTYYQLTAANFTVAKECIEDPARFAAVYESENTDGIDKYTLINELKKLESETTLYRGAGADDFLMCMISDVSVDTQEAELFHTNYSNISNTIDMQRQSISGVDEDEEALDLVKFQNAYNLASKMISVMSEMYNRLILETGV